MTQPLILHCITGLNTGGAETALLQLLRQSSLENGARHLVVSLISGGSLEDEYKKLGIEVISLGMSKTFSDIFCLMKFLKIIKERNPKIIQTWMYHANLLGALVHPFTLSIPLFWGIRHSELTVKDNGMGTYLVAKTCALFSRFSPREIFCNSHRSLESHTRMGYRAHKMTVIPNGFNPEFFHFDPSQRKSWRLKLGISDAESVVGFAGRYCPEKDFRTFFHAASLLKQKLPAAKFVLCGQGVSRSNPEINRLCIHFGLGDEVFFLGHQDNMAAIYPAFDVFWLTSKSESFPNVLAEAMLSGVPCISTDVGDAAGIMNAPDRVTGIGDAAGIAEMALALLTLDPVEYQRQRELVRAQIETNFSIQNILKQYRDRWGI